MYPTYTVRRNGLLFLIFYCTCLQAQTIIPLLGPNNRYGFADSLGNILVQPQFQYAWLPDNQGIAWALDTAEQFHMVQNDGTIVPTGLSQTGGISSPPHLQFRQGLCVIYKTQGGFNILHKRRGLVFGQDYPGCTMLNSEYIVLENNSGQMALADSSGRLRTGFNFSKISLAPLKDRFYAAQFDLSDPHGDRWKWMLMDQNGNSALNSAFKNPTIAGKTWIIADKNDKYGLIDLNQQEIMPFTFWSLQFIRDSLFLAEKSYPFSDPNKTNGRTEDIRYTIIDIHHRELLPRPMGRLWFNADALPYFEASLEFDLQNKWIMDSSFQIIHKDSFSTIEQSYDGRFRVSQNGVNGYPDRHGIVDYSGRQIVPTEFQLIMEMQQRSGYLVYKDSLWGFFSYSGQQVLPAKFPQIQHEITDSTNLLWVNPHRDKILFTAYDLNGKRLPVPDQNCLNPSMGMRSDEINELFENGSLKFILPDGTKAEAPGDNWSQHNIYTTPHGNLIVAQVNSDYLLYDSWLKRILPIGFSLPKNYYTNPSLSHGLIPVVNQTESGVIDARGNWVKKPNKSRYKILRVDMYAEFQRVAAIPDSTNNIQGRQFPLGWNFQEQGLLDTSGIVIHMLKPGVHKPLIIHFIDGAFIDQYLLVGRLFKAPNTPGGYVMKYAFLDTLGELTTPFIFKNPPKPLLQNPYPNDGGIYCLQGWIPSYRYQTGSAVIYTDDFKEKHVLVNGQGKIILALDSLSIYNYRDGAACVKYAGKTGLLDSLGNMLIPVIYDNLWVVISGKIFCAKVDQERYQYFRFDGTPLPIAPVYGSWMSYGKMLPDGYILLNTELGWIILNPELKPVTSPVAADRYPKLVREFPALLEFMDETNNRFYLNYRGGVSFRARR